MTSSLQNRNVTIAGQRTSMRLEPEMWDALAEVCRREGLSLHSVCSDVEQSRARGTVTSAMRVFLLRYYRQVQAPSNGPQAGGSRGRRSGVSSTYRRALNGATKVAPSRRN
jgi:predicted DNA-binding ribbon-helix-helix protein